MAAALAPLAAALAPTLIKSLSGRGKKKNKKLSKMLSAVSPAAGGLASMFGFDQRKLKSKKKARKRGNARLDQRTLQVNKGGQVLEVANAPVAFARRPISTFKKEISRNQDGMLVHVCDKFTDVSVTTNSSSVLLNPGSGFAGFVPVSSSVFPNFFVEFEPYEEYKVKKLTLHYVHFVPTSYAGSVALIYQEDALFANPTTTAQAAAYKSTIFGSVYEDFAMDVGTETLGDQWYYNDASVASGADNRFNLCGDIGWMTDNVALAATTLAPTTTYKLGYLFVEAVLEFRGRRPASAGPGIVLRAERAFQDASPGEEDLVVSWCIKELTKLWIDKKRSKKTARGRTLIEEIKDSSLQDQVQGASPALRSLSLTRKQ